MNIEIFSWEKNMMNNLTNMEANEYRIFLYFTFLKKK